MIGVSEPQNEDYALGVKKLNKLIRYLDAMGEHLWTISNTESTLTTVASQQTYTTGVGASNISASILNLEYAAVLVGSDYKELTIYDKPTSFRTILKSDTSAEPCACYLDRKNRLASNVLYLYPTPNSVYTIKYNFRRPLYDFALPTDNPDFPYEFELPLEKLLAYELSFDYSKPLAERQLLQQEGKLSWEETVKKGSDEPTYNTLRASYF